ncbi:hypothetical protein D3C81_1674670 [compost metagenome]
MVCWALVPFDERLAAWSGTGTSASRYTGTCATLFWLSTRWYLSWKPTSTPYSRLCCMPASCACCLSSVWLNRPYSSRATLPRLSLTSNSPLGAVTKRVGLLSARVLLRSRS